MKILKSPLFVLPAAGLVVATLLHAADVRIKDIATTSTVPASDDYVALDGVTNGTRKIKPLNFFTGTSGGIPYFSAANTVGTSAALASGNIVVGGGAGAAPTSSNLTVSGNNITIPGNTTTANLTVTNNASFANLTVTNLTISGTITGVIAGANGGTGVANTGKTITIGGNFTHTGAHTLNFTTTGNTAVTLPTSGTLGTLAGTEILTEKQVLDNGALGTDDTWTGSGITGMQAGATIAQWEVVYMGGSSKWLLADANGSGTYPARGLAVAAYSDTDAAVVIIRGTVRNDAWNWTVGGTLYLSTTAGGLTQTAPSTSGDKVQQVGYALTADIAFFDFASGEYLTVQ